jgi:hypothetical protein
MAGQLTVAPQDEPGPQDRAHSRLVPWEQLPDRARARYAEAARGVPATLASVGFQVLRDDTARQERTLYPLASIQETSAFRA